MEGQARPTDVIVTVRFGAVPSWHDVTGTMRAQSIAEEPNGVPILRLFAIESNRFRMVYSDGVTFFVDHESSQIWVSYPARHTAEYASPYLLGTVLGLYLRLKGKLCLHATTVEIEGRAFAFCGAPGAGKSTLAVAAALSGLRVLADDVTCLDDRDDGFWVRPAFAKAKLRRPALELLGLSSGEAPVIAEGWDRHYFSLDVSGYETGPSRLAGIYLLARRQPLEEAAAIHPLTGYSALSNLLAHASLSRLLPPNARPEEFGLIGKLVRAVPTMELTINSDGRRLFEACAWIRNHAARMPV